MTLRDRLHQWLREPLVHFLIAGAALFAVDAMRGGEVDTGDRKIVVTAGQVTRLTSNWMRTWQRPPTDAELDGLIRDYIKEEIYYREALRLDLDRDDAIIRRRLRSKMEFLATAEAENATPSDDELQVRLDRNPAKYARAPAFSFDQVYVAVGESEDTAMAKARRLLQRLKGGADAGALGDVISLSRTFEATTKSDIAREFGDEFAAALPALPQGQWSGPVPSGFGLHLVRVRKVTAPGAPELAQVRQAVENDWRAESREMRESAAYQVLLDSYDITIERPK